MACACRGLQQQFGLSCACGSPCGCGGACGTTRLRITRVLRLPLDTLGELRGVIYRKHGLPGEPPKNYVHFFKRAPLLAADPMGRRLFIIGGQYRVTRRGIEG
jgi:hypothetical protein